MADVRERVVIGVVLAVCAVAEQTVRDANVLLPYGLLLCLFTTLPLLLPHVWLAAGAVTAACATSLAALGGFTFAGCAALLVVLYLVGRDGAYTLAAAFIVPFAIAALLPQPGAIARAAAVLAPVAAGAGIVRWARTQAERQSAAEQTIGATLLENTAKSERARIARELHDVVAHHISMIAVQAETARLATPGMPADGAKRLLSIGDTARTALTEMRRLLGVLREDAGGTQQARQPQPGLAQLVDLVAETRATTGSAVRLIVSGPVAELDPGVELTAYRIVQEALTNARRHAPGTAVDIELHYEANGLRLRVRDLGPGPRDDIRPDAHGLLGMRERAATVGGDLHIGPAPGGGFLIEATLPARSGSPA
ncbi:sensor histidine kinase [Actinomadura rupiterrae]|uniref:sensor histidine kinase n=1 Tax=Actinomadura rupiterrae TaxID=559627 RepID=UPI0020A3325A|nr:sensor histidine kinase [Actinomadura rupiterrae]MCP2334798.1 signal transduction histidine kinase [Actinomadura rupiterrae]